MKIKKNYSPAKLKEKLALEKKERKKEINARKKDDLKQSDLMDFKASPKKPKKIKAMIFERWYWNFKNTLIDWFGDQADLIEAGFFYAYLLYFWNVLVRLAWLRGVV